MHNFYSGIFVLPHSSEVFAIGKNLGSVCHQKEPQKLMHDGPDRIRFFDLDAFLQMHSSLPSPYS